MATSQGWPHMEAKAAVVAPAKAPPSILAMVPLLTTPLGLVLEAAALALLATFLAMLLAEAAMPVELVVLAEEGAMFG